MPRTLRVRTKKRHRTTASGNAGRSVAKGGQHSELREQVKLPENGFNVFGFTEFPQDWCMATIGSLATRMVGGGTPSTKVAAYWDGDIPWTTSAVISEETLYLTTHQRCITRRGLEESSTQLIPKGSVLIGTRVGVGKTAVTTHDIAISQDLTALIPKPDVSTEYVALVLKSAPLAMWFDENKRGTTIKGVSRNDVTRLMIPLPSLSEQREIAAVLRTVQRAKEACEQVIAATRQLKQSLLNHLFTYGPVPFDQADKVPLKETDAGPISENWQITNLEMLKASPKGAIVSGPFGSNIGKRFFVPSGVPLIRGCNLTTGEALFVEEGFVFITEEKAQELANCTALPGDLIFTAAGTIGQVGLIPEKRRFQKYVISNKQLRARVDKSKADPLFLFYWFTEPRMQALIKERKSGTSIPVINLSVLRTLPIGLPSLPEQREIATQLSTIDAKLAVEEARRAAFDNLFKSLLHHLMTGKVRVNHLIGEPAEAFG